MNIAVIGFKGTGKTAVCRLLARNMGKKLISTDDETLSRLKGGIGKFVKKHGVEKLREIESNIIEDISNFEDCVFDIGCDIVMRNENVISLKKSSLIVLLTSDIKKIKERIKDEKWISEIGTKPNAISEILSNYEAKCRKAADYIIDTSKLSPEEVCSLIMHYAQMEIQ
jgi:shikimate kinase